MWQRRHFSRNIRAIIRKVEEMKKIIIISDFIEGKPVVASVRYADLMQHINKCYETIVINNKFLGAYKSEYAKVNYKFNTIRSRFTQTLEDKEISKSYNKFEKILRNKFILSIWRNYSSSKIKFNKLNFNLFNQVNNILQNNDICAIFITVPDIHGLYIVDYIKRRYSNVPVIVEVRDIINHNIGKGNPRYTMKNAEKLLIFRADGIIALSDGIYEYYKKMDGNKKIKVIRNGYNEEEFSECRYASLKDKKKITLAHIGSIYKGRNLADFIEALIKISEKRDVPIEFDVVGYLDNEALSDFEYLRNKINQSRVNINLVGTVQHKKAIRYLKKCDISVVLTHKTGSDYAIPGKAFEYIGACKPIIAVTTNKELIELIDGTYGECAGHNIEEIVDKLLCIMKSEYNFEDRLIFSRENQANNIINFIEEIAT